MKKTLLLACLHLCLLQAAAQEKEHYHVKQVEFPQNASIEQKVEMAARLVPTTQQYEWQKLELTAFLHFGINTFTNREWGDGKEDPALFNPTGFDAEQWVKSLKEGGFKMAIITAKHHDGFCLWPTATTAHSVASSPWKEGKGDVVKELRAACDKYGMKFGVYLSPWDRNAPCYGDSPRYNEFFIRQLTELLTNYGEVHEVWFDGACAEGPNGKKQEYDWEAYMKVINTLQPKAVAAIMGDDIRWVGNEAGVGRETEWSSTVLPPSTATDSEKTLAQLGINNMSKDLGSRDMLQKVDRLFWYPSEVDVSIRPGWFYHTAEDDKVKPLAHLVDIYFKSVGYNSVLLLNIPPDRRGRIHENDAARIKELADYIAATFATDYVRKGSAPWQPAEGESRVYKLKTKARINVVMLQEDIRRGQRVEAFKVEALTSEGWTEVAQGTTVGYKRLLRFPAIEAKALRVTLMASRLKANIAKVGAYFAGPVKEASKAKEPDAMKRDGWKLLSEAPLTVDLGKNCLLKSFTYAPANGEATPDMAYKFCFLVSNDGEHWTEVRTHGEFSNIMHNPQPQTVVFDKAVEARYVKLEATSPNGRKAKVTMGEIALSD
ncbi:alpha-L-fucosidase [Bacteroides heparinolyticus]|uniref:alpha-L-fucosidase n=1 Tax=Prevotella heparinolytica TaxID=28113 RepID=A0A4R2LY04_9BACE|nr:alpha-L-fucosidase [Bacteroides heparinolyticus]TCO96423.1 alpha-L-fucosidase [Bacteroides heparinolyticus]